MKEIPCAFHPKQVCPNCLGCRECEYLKAKPLRRKEIAFIDRIAQDAENRRLREERDLLIARANVLIAEIRALGEM